MSASSPNPIDDLIGSEIGGYRVVSMIGKGGMGAVYRAVQPASDAEVAIKVLARDLVGDRESSERFVQEARIANRVRHEGLVKVLFVGLLDDHRPYLIMEHLTGEPLSQQIGRGLPLAMLLKRLAEAARAIEAMHDGGVVHRDLKPSNLFVTTAGYIKVLDFGIAKLADDRSGLTRTGHTIGTPEYMSPEQAQADPLDARSDIFSFGVLLYEVVAGTRPHAGRFVEALAERSGPPPLPDGLPRTLDEVMRRTMAFSPKDRYTTAGELAAALDAIAGELPPETRAAGASDTVPEASRVTEAIEPVVEAPATRDLRGAPATTAPPPPTASTHRERAVPQRLGRYIVEGTAGQGGEGVVLIGVDRTVRRKVAIKLLATDAEDRRARVIAEAQAMARVNHPNIVTLYELGEDDGQLFLVMEFVEGSDLETWLASPRAWQTIVAMFVQAGHGLAAAHAVGVVHRDFKPANVLLGTDGRPRVGDFGIAELGARTGDGAGTAIFMAPEQVQGGVVDARADQFAFCSALWRALHGELPYPGATAIAIALAAFAGELRPPVASVPSAVNAVLRRGLAADPASRFPDLPALLVALAHAARAPRRRWPLVAGAGIAATVGLVLVARGRTEEIARPPKARHIGLAEIRNLPDATDRLRALAALPVRERDTEEARVLARDAAVDGFVRRTVLEGDPVAEAASISRDGVLVVPVGRDTIAIAPDGTQRKLPAPPRIPRRLVLADRELRALFDDEIVATPLDAAAWKVVARCNYEGMLNRKAEADHDLTMLACIGSSSAIVVDGTPSSIRIDLHDQVVFTPSRRVVVRGTDSIEVFDPAKSTPVARRAVRASQVSATDDLVASIVDGVVELWDVTTDQVLQPASSPIGPW